MSSFKSKIRTNDDVALKFKIQTNDVKDPDTLLSARDEATQQMGFLAIFLSVVAGSFGFVSIYDSAENFLSRETFAPFYSILPYVLSSAYIAAGISHFALRDTFEAFVPPKGSWGGLWQIPAPYSDNLGLSYERYHNYWSGVAEIILGISMAAVTAGLVACDESGDRINYNYIAAAPPALLYLLTLAVTPANIYMYTHDPVVPRIPPLTYPWGHAARGLLQCGLLAVFYKLTLHYYGIGV